MPESLIQLLLSLVDTLHQLVAMLVTLAVCGIALVAGGSEERWTGIVIFLATLATPIAQNTLEGPLLLATRIGIDVLLLAFLVTLALRSSRHWPLWAAGFHMVSLLAYVAWGFDRSVVPQALTIALNLIAYLVLLALLLGVLGRRRIRAEATVA